MFVSVSHIFLLYHGLRKMSSLTGVTGLSFGHPPELFAGAAGEAAERSSDMPVICSTDWLHAVRIEV